MLGPFGWCRPRPAQPCSTTRNGSKLERPDRLPEDDKVSTPPLRVMLVDDHEVVRDGIKALLAATDDITVCA